MQPARRAIVQTSIRFWQLNGTWGYAMYRHKLKGGILVIAAIGQP